MTAICSQRTLLSDGEADACQIDPDIQPLVAALQQLGCETEASCEGHLEVLASGEPCTPRLPYVVFRAPGEQVIEILELAAELYTRPPSRTRLYFVWYVESCPCLEGGVLHTLTPHFAYRLEQLTEADLQAAQRDSHTLAAFLLLRCGRQAEASERSASRPVRRSHRLPGARSGSQRTAGYARGSLRTAGDALAAARGSGSR